MKASFLHNKSRKVTCEGLKQNDCIVTEQNGKLFRIVPVVLKSAC